MPGENENQELEDGVDEAEDAARPEGLEDDGENEDPAGEPGEGEDDGSAEEEIDAAPGGGDGGKKPGRAESRIQRLRQEAQEARTREAEANKRLETVLSQQRQAPQPSETPEMEQARLALMTPEERTDYKLAQSERRNQANMAQMQFQMQETSDQAYFRGLVATDPVAAKYASRVEAKLAEIRSKGQNVNREALLDLLVGQDIRARRAKEAPKQRAAADKRIERQRAAPGNSKGDQPGEKRGGKTAEERLANVTF